MEFTHLVGSIPCLVIGISEFDDQMIVINNMSDKRSRNAKILNVIITIKIIKMFISGPKMAMIFNILAFLQFCPSHCESQCKGQKPK